MAITIYHNPRCSKSREALGLLQARGAVPRVHEYLLTPLNVEQLQLLCQQMGLGARALLRSGEPAYEALGLADERLDEASLLAALANHPALLQRPIVVNGERALIARPPELALSLL
ncbi:MAG: arsenate reductase (glutaredoxin) [Burkholderiaceae bacterium]